MNTDELSTGGGSPSAKSKKREGEKRTSPLTPLREKGKGKEEARRGRSSTFPSRDTTSNDDRGKQLIAQTLAAYFREVASVSR